MITEDYVSLEVAKLLSTKGFNGEFHKHYWGYESGKEFLTSGSFNSEYDYPAPTLQMAMKWLREVHKLNIEPVPACYNFEHQDIHDGWCCDIRSLTDLSYNADYEYNKKFKSYEQAAEAAIKYALENLI